MPLPTAQWMGAILLGVLAVQLLAFDEEGDDKPHRLASLDQSAIVAKADTADALIAKCKPIVAWHARDMMWADFDSKGAVRITLARPHYVVVDGDKPAWFVLRRQPLPTEIPEPANKWEATFKYLYANIAISEKIPQDDFAGNFAVLMAHSERQGSLYEIGWEAGPEGNGCWVEGRRIFLLRDIVGKWRLVAEAPPELHGHGGDICDEHRSTFRARWSDSAGTPVEIEVVICDSVNQLENKDTVPLSGLAIYREGVLTGLDRSVRWTCEKYVVSKKGESLDMISRDIEEWTNHITFPRTLESRMLARKIIREKVQALNPQLIGVKIEADAHVYVPGPYEVADLLRAKLSNPPAESSLNK